VAVDDKSGETDGRSKMDGWLDGCGGERGDYLIEVHGAAEYGIALVKRKH